MDQRGQPISPLTRQDIQFYQMNKLQERLKISIFCISMGQRLFLDYATADKVGRNGLGRGRRELSWPISE